MKKIVLLSIFISIHWVAYNQIINGTILDKNTKAIIYSASVFFDGTSVGTLSDDKGNFRINISRFPMRPITISAISYYSVSLTNYPEDKPVIIYLVPKTYELNEIVVKGKSHWMKRNDNLTIFRNEFLGTTGNAINCVITNEKDIKFKSSADDDTLTAFSNNPLLIDNKALGYNITYFLDKFEYCKSSQSFIFEGKIFFKEDSAYANTKKAQFEKRRRKTYQGSRMHFLRSLWIDNLNSAGFYIKNSANERINYRNIVIEKDNRRKYLSYPSGFGISSYTVKPTSFIVFRKGLVYFDATGYYEPNSIIWEGEMARQRIADQLPFEYSPNEY